jgi:hypothetical protein
VPFFTPSHGPPHKNTRARTKRVIDPFFVAHGPMFRDVEDEKWLFTCTCNTEGPSDGICICESVASSRDTSTVRSYGSVFTFPVETPRVVTADDEDETILSEMLRHLWDTLLQVFGVSRDHSLFQRVPRAMRPVKTTFNHAHGFLYRCWLALAEFAFHWSVVIQVVLLVIMSLGSAINIDNMSHSLSCWDLKKALSTGSISEFEKVDELTLNTSELCSQTFIIIAVCTGLQFSSVLLAFSYCFHNLREAIISLWSIGGLFIAMVLSFAGGYELCLFMDPEALYLYQPIDFRQFGLQVVSMIYFSAVTASSVGFGDISPQNVGSSVLSTLQMTMSTIFMVVLFGVALSNLRIHMNEIPYPPRPPRKRFFARGFLYRNHFLIISLLTIANLMVLQYAHFQAGPLKSYIFVLAISTSLQLLLCWIEIRLLLKVLRSYENHVLSVRFAVKGYVSQAITFAVIYCSMSVFLDGKAFYISYLSDNNTANLSVWNSMMVHLFFSFTAQTSTGYGNVFPIHPYSQCVVIVQLLLTVVFNVVIFGTCASNVVDEITTKRRTVDSQNSSLKPVALN